MTSSARSTWTLVDKQGYIILRRILSSVMSTRFTRDGHRRVCMYLKTHLPLAAKSGLTQRKTWSGSMAWHVRTTHVQTSNFVETMRLACPVSWRKDTERMGLLLQQVTKSKRETAGTNDVEVARILAERDVRLAVIDANKQLEMYRLGHLSAPKRKRKRTSTTPVLQPFMRAFERLASTPDSTVQPCAYCTEGGEASLFTCRILPKGICCEACFAKQGEEAVPRPRFDRTRVLVWMQAAGTSTTAPCTACERLISWYDFHACHVVAAADGGPWHPSNLRVGCQSCNASSGTANFLEFARSLRGLKPSEPVEHTDTLTLSEAVVALDASRAPYPKRHKKVTESSHLPSWLRSLPTTFGINELFRF